MQYGDPPHDHEPEDWEMKTVGRHLYKVLVDHTQLEANWIILGAPKLNGVRAFRLLTRHFDP